MHINQRVYAKLGGNRIIISIFKIAVSLVAQWVSLVAQLVKNPCNEGELGSIPGLERSLEKEKAAHSSILA